VPHRSRPSRSRTGGQALVETALVLPLFLLLIFGLIDLGRFVITDHMLSQAAREGARLGAVEASWRGSSDPACGTPGGPVCPASDAVLRAHVLDAANRMVTGIGGTITSVQLSCTAPGHEPTGAWTGSACASNRTGDVVSVRVEFTYEAITPVISSLIGSVPRQGAATMVIN
jgi:TadE-like protein